MTTACSLLVRSAGSTLAAVLLAGLIAPSLRAEPDTPQSAPKAPASTEAARPPGSEARAPYTREELMAFGAVGAAFALAWASVNAMREWERWLEFRAQRDERLLEATTRQTRALIDLSRVIAPNQSNPNTPLQLVAEQLRTTADFVKARADETKRS